MTVRMHTTIEYQPFLSLQRAKVLSENSFSVHIEAILSHFVVNSRQFDVQMYRASLENLCRKTNKARESVFYLLAVRNSTELNREKNKKTKKCLRANRNESPKRATQK